MIIPTFSDGIGAIAIVGGTVRVDFVVLSPDEPDAEGRPKVVPQQRVVMTLDAFLRASEKVKEAAQAIAKLAQNGGQLPNAAPAAAPAQKHTFP